MSTEKNDIKGGRKGGVQFPRYSLAHLEPYLKELVSKTYTNTISIEQLSAGVFKVGAKSNAGKIKSAALKQFGLLNGDYKKFKATELASKISISEGIDKEKLLRMALFNVVLFKNVFNTYQNSTTDKQKIAQYIVSTLKIHPDVKDDFVKVFIESAVIAKICTLDGNTISFNMSEPEDASENYEAIEEPITANSDNSEFNNTFPINNNQINTSRTSGQISNINVNIDVDPSMDPEKLEKLLKLLKNYGAI